MQAALASAGSFAAGALLPLLVVIAAPGPALLPWLCGSTLVFLAALGALAAHAGGAGMWVGAGRVTFWGALALGITWGVGTLFGATV